MTKIRPSRDDPAFAHRTRRDGYGYHAIEDPCFDAHPPTQAELEQFWTDEYIPPAELPAGLDLSPGRFVSDRGDQLRVGMRARTADGAIRQWTGEGWIRVGDWDPSLPLPTINEDHIERGQE